MRTKGTNVISYRFSRALRLSHEKAIVGQVQPQADHD